MPDDQRIHIFSGPAIGTLFAGLIPKGPFVSVSLLNHQRSKDKVGRFLDLAEVQDVLTAKPERVCGCNPRIAVSKAQNFYADRFVAIGDAAVTRLYKDGIGSAFLTARQAAQVALELGVAADAFHRGYAPLCRALDRDNRVGRLLFALWGYMQNNRRFSRAWLNVLFAEEGMVRAQQYGHRILWSMFTGDDSYQTIARYLCHPGMIFKFLLGLFRSKPSQDNLNKG